MNDTHCIELSLPAGDRARLALFGAHLLSWTTADGVERLYLSPEAVFDGTTPIRGGIPICFPQFNVRGPLPKHGLVRTLPWQAEPDADRSRVRLRLRDGDATRRWWPHAFEACVTVQLSPNVLRIGFDVCNTDSMPWTFALALHSYLRVQQIAQVRLAGLKGLHYWDALADRGDANPIEQNDALTFDQPTDRVYAGVRAAAVFELREPGRCLRIMQSDTLTEAVVWNPGEKLSAALPDLPDDGWREMLCVEAAKVDQPVRLAPRERWQAWQQFEAVA